MTLGRHQASLQWKASIDSMPSGSEKRAKLEAIETAEKAASEVAIKSTLPDFCMCLNSDPYASEIGPSLTTDRH